MKRSNYLIIIFLLVGLNLHGQPPNYIYEGGDGSGFEIALIGNEIPFFYIGGIGEGHSSKKHAEGGLVLYEGGDSGGYNSSQYNHSGSTFFQGGDGQGYVIQEKCEDFIWTGFVGTGWGVAENWSYDMVPTLKRRAIIPAGAPNYPSVNAGILAIRENPNSGEFVCQSMWIQVGGYVITRINNFVENYGKILIDGSMHVKNSAAGAIKNMDEGEIQISSTGSLIIKP